MEAGHRREMGRKEVERCGGLPGLGMGMMVAHFQIEGRSEWVMERLKRQVRKVTALGPKCFKWSIETPSGPTAVEFFARFIAAIVSSSLKGGGG